MRSMQSAERQRQQTKSDNNIDDPSTVQPQELVASAHNEQVEPRGARGNNEDVSPARDEHADCNGYNVQQVAAHQSQDTPTTRANWLRAPPAPAPVGGHMHGGRWWWRRRSKSEVTAAATTCCSSVSSSSSLISSSVCSDSDICVTAAYTFGGARAGAKVTVGIRDNYSADTCNQFSSRAKCRTYESGNSTVCAAAKGLSSARCLHNPMNNNIQLERCHKHSTTTTTLDRQPATTVQQEPQPRISIHQQETNIKSETGNKLLMRQRDNSCTLVALKSVCRRRNRSMDWTYQQRAATSDKCLVGFNYDNTKTLCSPPTSVATNIIIIKDKLEQQQQQQQQQRANDEDDDDGEVSPRDINNKAQVVADNSSSSSDYCSDSLGSLITANCGTASGGASGEAAFDDKTTCSSSNVSPEQSSFELSGTSSGSSRSSCRSRLEAHHECKGRSAVDLTTSHTSFERPAPGRGSAATLGATEPSQTSETDDRGALGMDAFCNQSLEDRLGIAQLHKGGYPNNTLIVDLSKCHRNITSPWPNQPSGPCRSSRSWLSPSHWWPSFCRPGNGFQANSYNTHNRPRTRRRTKLQFHMPDPLLRTDVSLKLEDYDKALSVLTSDIRYHLHLLLYRRIRTVWLLLSTLLCIVLPILLTNLESLVIICAFTSWLSLQIAGAFLTTQFRCKLDQMLEKSVAQVNSFLLDHNLMLGVINVGCLFSKSKLIIPMLYFDTSQCREQIESIISIDSRKDDDGGDDSNKHILDYSRIDLPLTKPNTMAFAQSQLAKKIILRYSQRWISYFDKRKLMFTDDRIRPRHLSTGKCLCQFIEEHFSNDETTTFNSNNHMCEEQSPPLSAKHPQSMTPTTNNRHQMHLKPPPKQLIEETQVKRKVIGSQEASNALPTISRLVSQRDQTTPVAHENHQATIDSGGCANDVQVAQRKDQSKPNGFTVLNSWHHLLGTENETVVDMSNMTANCNSDHNQQQFQTPTTSSPDLSMEIGCDSISRRDDLVRKLRLLLELRKNELQGIDGSELFSLSKTQLLHSPLLPIPTDPPHKTDEQKGDSLTSSKGRSEDEASTKVRGGVGAVRFYTQNVGWFFGGKKTQQRQQQPQEIC